jgi:hypothetical protein
MKETSARKTSSLAWVFISLAGFAVFLITAVLFGLYSDKLNFISGSSYFFLLIPMALASAAFLFGALHSHAKYTGKMYGGTIELGGPVVVLLLVVGLGYKFRPQEKSFGFTINVFSATDTAKVINSGNADVFFGTAHWVKSISDGQAVFSEIPDEYKGKQVSIITSAEGYTAKKITLIVPVNEATDIYLTKIADSVTIHGLVKDKKGKTIKNAVLVFADGRVKTTSDEYGNFEAALPFKDGTEVALRVYIHNEIKYDNLVTLSSATSLSVFLDSL